MLKHAYKQRTATTINFELSLIKDFRELCKEERKSLSEKFHELMIRELDRNKEVITSY